MEDADLAIMHLSQPIDNVCHDQQVMIRAIGVVDDIVLACPESVIYILNEVGWYRASASEIAPLPESTSSPLHAVDSSMRAR